MQRESWFDVRFGSYRQHKNIDAKAKDGSTCACAAKRRSDKSRRQRSQKMNQQVSSRSLHMVLPIRERREKQIPSPLKSPGSEFFYSNDLELLSPCVQQFAVLCRDVGH
jgi:hypothetical protein